MNVREAVAVYFTDHVKDINAEIWHILGNVNLRKSDKNRQETGLKGVKTGNIEAAQGSFTN
jgi:hypothetical protein